MKKMIFSAVAFAVVAVSAVAVAPTTSEAVPAFARQTGAACLNCHFQAIPRLAAFGRNFRMNAFRDMGEQALIEDEHLSLPAVFNASFLMKARFSTGDQKTTTAGVTTTTAKGGLIGTPATGSSLAVQFPDETALLFGGRLGEHAGLFNEFGFNGTAFDVLGYKIAYVFDLDSGIVALALGSTDALGMSSIMNDPSNAVSRNTRGVQTRAFALRSTVHHTGATGLGVYGHLNDMLYFAVGTSLGQSAGGAAVGNAGVDVVMSPYLRAAYTGEVAGMDAVIGGWYAKTNVANYKQLAVAKDPRTEYGIDIQLQGDVGDLSVGFYAPIVLSAKTDTPLTATEVKVTGYMPMVQIASGPMGVRLAYDYAKTTTTVAGIGTSSKYTNFVVGAWYDVAQNLTLDLEMDAMKTTTAATSVKQTATTLQVEYVY